MHLSRWCKQTLLWPHNDPRMWSSRAKSISRCLHRYVCLFTDIQDNSKWLIKHLAFRTSNVKTLPETLYYSWQETVETGKKIVRIPLYVSELVFFTEQSLLWICLHIVQSAKFAAVNRLCFYMLLHINTFLNQDRNWFWVQLFLLDSVRKKKHKKMKLSTKRSTIKCRLQENCFPLT